MSRTPWNIGRLPEKAAKRIRFTPELWDKWRAARCPDAHTLILRDGIREVRARIQIWESMLTPVPACKAAVVDIIHDGLSDHSPPYPFCSPEDTP